jgi:hypothetical protein
MVDGFYCQIENSNVQIGGLLEAYGYVLEVQLICKLSSIFQ